MSGGISTDEVDFVLTLSVILLCFVSLLWVVVVLLFLWIRKLHQRVDRASKKWSGYSKLALNTGTETEHSPKNLNTYSLPLVISNKRAVNSDKNKSWKNINRTFAYADLEDGENRRDMEGSSEGRGEGDKSSVDGQSNARVETPPKVSEDASCVGIRTVEDGPTVLFLGGEQPDEKYGKRRIFLTLKGPQENDNHHKELCEESAPAKTERLVLVDAEGFAFDKEKKNCQNGTQESHSKDEPFERSGRKNACVVVIGETDRETESESKAPNAVEKNNEDVVIADDTIQDEKECLAGTSGIPASAESTTPHHEGESEDLISTGAKPKEKRPHKRRKRTKRPKETRMASGESVTPLNHLDEHGNLADQHVTKLVDGERKNITIHEFQKASMQHHESRPQQDGHEYVCTKDDVPVSEYQADGIHTDNGVQMKRNDVDEDNYDYITTSDIKQWPTKSLGNQMHAQDADEYETKRADQDVQNTAEQIYANIDDCNDGFRQMYPGDHSQTIYVNCRNSEHVDVVFPHDSPIYDNTDEVERESAMLNDNFAFDDADEGPIYINVKELKDI